MNKKTAVFDPPLPSYLLRKLTSRAQEFVRQADLTCRSFLDLTWEYASTFRNVGHKTWAELDALKTDVRRIIKNYETSGVAPEDGSPFMLHRAAFASFDEYLAAYLDYYPKTKGCNIIFEHRFGLLGSGKTESLEAVSQRFTPVLTRERIRQISDKIQERWFGESSRCLVSDLLDAALPLLTAHGGAMSLAEFTSKMDEVSGWKPTQSPARMVRFLRFFNIVDFYPKPQVVALRNFAEKGETAQFARRFKAFCMDERRPFSELDYGSFSTVNPSVSYQAYQLMAFKLMMEKSLPPDKQRQLKVFATQGRVSFLDAGDARRLTSKLITVLKDARMPLSLVEWLRKARLAYPDDDIRTIQIRRVSRSFPLVVNYDRGKFIWHEYVSIPPKLLQAAEKHFADLLNEHDLDACSVYRYYYQHVTEFDNAGIPSLTLFYFLMKCKSNGVLDFPEYPKVALPGKDGGPGSFDRMLKRQFPNYKETTFTECRRYYEDILCGDPRQSKWYYLRLRKG